MILSASVFRFGAYCERGLVRRVRARSLFVLESKIHMARQLADRDFRELVLRAVRALAGSVPLVKVES
jgi:hypothetical protein